LYQHLSCLCLCLHLAFFSACLHLNFPPFSFNRT
jgi:hypothetical protein